MNATRRRNPVAGVLPPKLAELVDEIGFPATLKLVEKWGGIRLYVPLEDNLSAEHPIAKEIGFEVARKLARAHSEWLEVPRAELPTIRCAPWRACARPRARVPSRSDALRTDCPQGARKAGFRPISRRA